MLHHFFVFATDYPDLSNTCDKRHFSWHVFDIFYRCAALANIWDISCFAITGDSEWADVDFGGERFGYEVNVEIINSPAAMRRGDLNYPCGRCILASLSKTPLINLWLS